MAPFVQWNSYVTLSGSQGDTNTKQIVYILMGVVAFVAHLTAFGIAKFKQSSDSSSGQSKGSSSGGSLWIRFKSW